MRSPCLTSWHQLSRCLRHCRAKTALMYRCGLGGYGVIHKGMMAAVLNHLLLVLQDKPWRCVFVWVVGQIVPSSLRQITLEESLSSETTWKHMASMFFLASQQSVISRFRERETKTQTKERQEQNIHSPWPWRLHMHALLEESSSRKLPGLKAKTHKHMHRVSNRRRDGSELPNGVSSFQYCSHYTMVLSTIEEKLNETGHIITPEESCHAHACMQKVCP